MRSGIAAPPPRSLCCPRSSLEHREGASWASNTVFLRLARIGGISERFQVTGAFAKFERSMIQQRVNAGPARPVAVIPFLSSDEVREHHRNLAELGSVLSALRRC